MTTSRLASRLIDHHADHLVARSELDALHAGRVAAHLAHVLLVEADRQAVTRREHDVVRAARDLHVDQLVALLDLDRLDAGRARVRVLRQRRLLHRALLRGEEQELIVAGTRAPCTIAETFVSGDTLIRLTTGLPLAARPACGISCTLSQKQRPSSVKTST